MEVRLGELKPRGGGASRPGNQQAGRRGLSSRPGCEPRQRSKGRGSPPPNRQAREPWPGSPPCPRLGCGRCRNGATPATYRRELVFSFGHSPSFWNRVIVREYHLGIAGRRWLLIPWVPARPPGYRVSRSTAVQWFWACDRGAPQPQAGPHQPQLAHRGQSHQGCPGSAWVAEVGCLWPSSAVAVLVSPGSWRRGPPWAAASLSCPGLSPPPGHHGGCVAPQHALLPARGRQPQAR